MKCSGGSTCVPVWSPKEMVETFAVSPLAIRRSGVIVGPGSLFHVVMSGRNTSDTSCTFIPVPRILSRHAHAARGRAHLPRGRRPARWPLPALVGQALAALSREVPGAAVAEADGAPLWRDRRARRV